MKFLGLGFSLLVSIMITGCASNKPADYTAAPPEEVKVNKLALPSSIDEAVASGFRTPSNMTRDRYRHPAETLKFFGVQPEMTVIEIWPSSGWYSEILAPLLAAKGHYTAAIRASTTSNTHDDHSFQDWLAAHADLKDSVGTATFNPGERIDLGAPASADVVLTFRNVHNWMKAGGAGEAFKAFFAVLKPGGVLGVVEHRAGKKSKQDPKAKSGYVREDYVIKLARDAGFKKVEKSEVNANPMDKKDYPEGVWTLPPSYTLGDKDHAKYEAIGESDRMTLKFVKPVK